jgi:putative Holliday junction resolvase
VSDPSGTLATPLCTVTRGDDEVADRLRLVDLVRETGAGTVVIGLPLGLDGGIGEAAKRARSEGKALVQLLRPKGVRVVYQDERLTTVSADRSLGQAGRRVKKRRTIIDQAAAVVILQAWLDSRPSSVPGAGGGR